MERKIKDTIRELKKAQIAKALLTELSGEQKSQRTALNGLIKEIQTINRSIDLLNNFSLEYLLKQLTGKRTIELEIRREHYLNLSLQFNELKKSLELLEFEIAVLKPKTKNIRAKKEELKNLLFTSQERITDGNLIVYRKVLKQLKPKIELAKEMDEAIIQGVEVNKVLNKTLRYLKTVHTLLQKFKKDRKTYKNYRIDKLDKYQNHITELHLEFLKFRKEYNDVYQRFFLDSPDSENILRNLFKVLRRNLLTDIRGNAGLQNSIRVVSNLKSNVMSLTRSLRSDVRKIEKEIVLLEKEEKGILKNII